jgi:prepilin-type N-terminal cleavage/methylation domain-containing protein
MAFRLTPTKASQSGYTLVEVMVATGVSLVVLAAIASFFLYCNRSFAFLTNHVFMEQQNRYAMDYLSQQIRQVRKLTAYTTNSLAFVDYDGSSMQIVYDPTDRTLARIKQGQRYVLLTGCTALQFSIYGSDMQSNTFDVTSTVTDPAQCKVVALTWTCSQTTQKVTNSEPLQCAKILIRNASGG